jgi:hypothetical protein
LQRDVPSPNEAPTQNHQPSSARCDNGLPFAAKAEVYEKQFPTLEAQICRHRSRPKNFPARFQSKSDFYPRCLIPPLNCGKSWQIPIAILPTLSRRSNMMPDSAPISSDWPTLHFMAGVGGWIPSVKL